MYVCVAVSCDIGVILTMNFDFISERDEKRLSKIINYQKKAHKVYPVNFRELSMSYHLKGAKFTFNNSIAVARD